MIFPSLLESLVTCLRGMKDDEGLKQEEKCYRCHGRGEQGKEGSARMEKEREREREKTADGAGIERGERG